MHSDSWVTQISHYPAEASSQGCCKGHHLVIKIVYCSLLILQTIPASFWNDDLLTVVMLCCIDLQGVGCNMADVKQTDSIYKQVNYSSISHALINTLGPKVKLYMVSLKFKEDCIRDILM